MSLIPAIGDTPRHGDTPPRRTGPVQLRSHPRAGRREQRGDDRPDEGDVIDAYGLVGLACYIAAAAAGEGLAVQLRLPVSEELQTHLARMHLGEVLDRYDVRSDGSLPEVRELDRRDSLIELRSFRDVHGSDQLDAFIWDRLLGRADNEVVTQLYEATGELGLNVVEHAGSPAGRGEDFR